MNGQTTSEKKSFLPLINGQLDRTMTTHFDEAIAHLYQENAECNVAVNAQNHEGVEKWSVLSPLDPGPAHLVDGSTSQPVGLMCLSHGLMWFPTARSVGVRTSRPRQYEDSWHLWCRGMHGFLRPRIHPQLRVSHEEALEDRDQNVRRMSDRPSDGK